ncbi:MAG: hypothetical protein M1812_000292 [Candelaria pacifica]|nr:MAG: hypothetical protein M1812_000292 [Candelaria pacifica]
MLGPSEAVAGAPASTSNPSDSYLPLLNLVLAGGCLGWYIFILIVSGIGCVQIQRHYSSQPRSAVSPTLPSDDVPHVSILRPVKGLEPSLYECLASTFRQTYPRSKLTIYFCVSSRIDPAYPVLERVLVDFPSFDAKIFVEDEDPNLHTRAGHAPHLGPNPKIRNLSRGYREGKGNIIWIIDCNVWIGKGVAGRMVDKLCGFSSSGQVQKYKFVHQLPLVVDTAVNSSSNAEGRLLHDPSYEEAHATSTSTESFSIHSTTSSNHPHRTTLSAAGGRLEELFLSSSHAKFYTAINTVAIAPCIVGKSNMFRRSHLSSLTSHNPSRAPGIDFFSDNICEDHLIGDLLWRGNVPDEIEGEIWGNHALVFGDLAIQPMAGMGVGEYVARRIRWLRVRKWTVIAATLVEPGTESLLCSAYGAFGVTTLLWFHTRFGIPRTWTAFVIVWLLSVTLWALFDWTVYLKLHSAASVEVDEYTPDFARPPKGKSRRPFREWLAAWVGREVLALPIWLWAVYGGGSVVWRGKKFRVGMDLRAHEIPQRGKARQD